MNLTVFQSGKGDCILLAGADGRLVLVDGGMPDAYAEHVSPALGTLAAAGKTIDLVYVSHIDQDHIGGILRLFDDAVAWKVFDFQQGQGNAGFPTPVRTRPPAVAKVWHNAFAEQIGRNAGSIASLLAATAETLSGASEPDVLATSILHGQIATSINEAIRLSRRLDPDQLGIPTNPEFGGLLVTVREPTQSVKIGGMRLTVIGPFQRDLRKLRTEWNAWLRKNKAALAEIADDARRDAEDLGLSELDRVLFPFLEAAKKLGQRSLVTAPNLASIMLLVEEGQRKLLLTGDGHGGDILAGLRESGRLAVGGGLHLDVLKVQHHGSEHNIDDPFCRTITADDYVFCGNGEHENPDLDVIRAIVRSRTGTAAERSPNPETGQPFRFWFNSSAGLTKKADAITHMQSLEALVGQLVASSGGQMKAMFLTTGSSFDLKIPA
jgi:hypothetical protein